MKFGRHFAARFDARNRILPEARKIDEALETMRARRSHLALVIDEFGGTAGLLTIEDILEELVGEIADEHDAHHEALVILDENSALVDALLHIDDLADDWNLVLPGGEFETVGGFVIESLGRAPLVGDRVETESANLTVQAVRGGDRTKFWCNAKPHPNSKLKRDCETVLQVLAAFISCPSD